MTLRGLEREYRGRVAPEDFSLLAAHALNREKEFVLREPDFEPDGVAEARLRNLLDRRMRHEPVAYLTGHREFYGLGFRVTSDTLIPRPETEHLVEAAIDGARRFLDAEPGTTVAVTDIGTGSGAIAVSLSHAFRDRPRIAFLASDVSPRALDVARENAAGHGLADRIAFLEGSLLEPFTKNEAFRDADALVVAANLPYLSDERYASAPPDVRNYEPESALRADNEGLALYDTLLRQLAIARTDRPVVGLFEIDPDQAEPIRALIGGHFHESEIDILPDLAGRARVARFRT